MKTLLAVLAAIVLFAGLVFWGGSRSYNELNALQQAVDKSWADVQNVYQRRADLIPNLVRVAEGAANFEKSTLSEVARARQQVTSVRVDPNASPSDPAVLRQFQQSQEHLSASLSRLLVVVERYPDLKAGAGFRDLQVQLEGTENRIAVERGRFNEAVLGYNRQINSMPARLYAGFLGFQPRPYFTSSPGAEKAPEVKFDFAPAAK